MEVADQRGDDYAILFNGEVASIEEVERVCGLAAESVCR